MFLCQGSFPNNSLISGTCSCGVYLHFAATTALSFYFYVWISNRNIFKIVLQQQHAMAYERRRLRRLIETIQLIFCIQM